MQRYKRLRLLGRGNYGVAWLAADTHNHNQYVALKLLSCNDTSLTAQQRIISEIKASLQCCTDNHPNICSYIEAHIIQQSDIDAGTAEQHQLNGVVLVLEYCNGGDLKQLIESYQRKRTPIDETTIWNILCHTLLALNHIHTAGHVVHRDLKPSNILLHRNIVTGVVTYKVCDFGISKVLESTSLASTRIGTPYYISPEIYAHESYTYNTDMWSLGCIVYELCTLQRVFSANNIQQLSQQVKHTNILPIPTVYSSNLRDLVDSMLTRDAAGRPSAAQLLTHIHVAPLVRTIVSNNATYSKFQLPVFTHTNVQQHYAGGRIYALPSACTRPSSVSSHRSLSSKAVSYVHTPPTTTAMSSARQPRVRSHSQKSHLSAASSTVNSRVSSIAPSSSVSNRTVKSTTSSVAAVPELVIKPLVSRSVVNTSTVMPYKPYTPFMLQYLRRYVAERQKLSNDNNNHQRVLADVIAHCDTYNDVKLVTYLFDRVVGLTASANQAPAPLVSHAEHDALRRKYDEMKRFAKQLYSAQKKQFAIQGSAANNIAS